MGAITVPDESWREDEDYERDVQRQLDDAAEVKRRASGFSPEQVVELDRRLAAARRAATETERCPSCRIGLGDQCHHEGDAAVPECWYFRCERCGHQWGHE